jgi:aspartate aminotransferase
MNRAERDVTPPPGDSFLAVVATCAADRRESKVDLLVGVYKDEAGRTPVMTAVRLAQQRVAALEETKGYLGVSGREAFTSSLLDLTLGTGELRRRALGLQTAGGAGALRLLFEMIKQSAPDATVWLAEPGYPGHCACASAASVRIRRFPYLSGAPGIVDAERILRSLGSAKRGDIVVLDASCHNPTGLDLSCDAWAAIGRLCQRQGLVPLIDIAYQGLALDIDSDVMSIQALSAHVDYLLAAVSCSKTFGIYRERTGAAVLIGPTTSTLSGPMRELLDISFATYGVPPDHGAAIVQTILTTPELRTQWLAELAGMRQRLATLRARFSEAMRARMSDGSFDGVQRGHGMFALLPLNATQMQRLRETFGIYGLDNGRINVACLRESLIEPISAAIMNVLAIRSTI